MQQDLRDCAPRKEVGSIGYIKDIKKNLEFHCIWLKVGGISEDVLSCAGRACPEINPDMRYSNPSVGKKKKKEPFCLPSKIAGIFGCLVVVTVLMLWICQWEEAPIPMLRLI